MVTIVVDEKQISVAEGTTVLEACLENGIYIPNLCYLPKHKPPVGSCRLCFVEIDGKNEPVPSCTTQVKEGMRVLTDTPQVRRLQKSGLRLLLSVHDVDCKNCHANKKCGLQNIAGFLKVGLKPKSLERILKEPAIDSRHPCLDYYPNRCVLCEKCIRVCRQENGLAQLTFARRGFATVIGYFGNTGDSEALCNDCRRCVDICPVGALSLRAGTSQ